MSTKEKRYTKNKLVKNFLDSPKKLICNMDTMRRLTPNEFYIHTLLLNAPSDFAPNFNYLAEIINMSVGTVQKTIDGLKEKGLVEIDRISTYQAVWYVNDVILDLEKHKDFLRRSYSSYTNTREKHNREIKMKIAELEIRLENTVGDEYQQIVEEIIKLEQSKK